MSAATNLISGASGELLSRWFPASPRSYALGTAAEPATRTGDARPSRVGGAPLAGAQAVTAYQRTAALDALQVLSRIDEHA